MRIGTKYVVQVYCADKWIPSRNFSYRIDGPSFESRVGAQRGLRKYRSKITSIKYRIVAERKPKKL